MSFGWVIEEPRVRSIREGKQASIDTFDFKTFSQLYRYWSGGNIQPGIGDLDFQSGCSRAK